MKTETWYVLEDGTSADPRDVAPDDAGALKHKDGRAVAYSPHGPRSRSLDPDEERAKTQATKAKGDADAKAKTESKDMKTDDHAKRPYRTRETKAE